jgi:hypothetical protein
MIKPAKPPFAATKISAGNSQAEIHGILKKYGADGIRWTDEHGKTTLEFYVDTVIEGIPRQLMVRLNPPPFKELRRTWDNKVNHYVRKEFPNDAVSMRLLKHYLEIKLALVAWGVRPFEEEFLSEILVSLPGQEPVRMIEVLKQKSPMLLGLPETINDSPPPETLPEE